MRWSYVIPRLSALLLLWLAVFFGFDPLLKWGLKKAGQSVAGAKVDIGRVKTRFFPPSINIVEVAVADKANPFTNIVEFNSLSFGMAGRPLLEKKVLVEKASLSGLQFSTQRKTSGALPFAPKEPESAVEKKMKEMGSSLAAFGAGRVQDIKASALSKIDVSADSLESVKVAKEQEQKITAGAEIWKQETQTLGSNEKIAAIKAKISALDKESNPLAKIQLADSLRKDISAVKEEIAAKNKNLAEFMEQSKASLALIDAARQRDVATAMQKLSLPSLDSKSLTLSLLGPQIGPKLGKGLYWYAKLKKYMPEGKTPKPAPERKGTIIHFPKEKSYPSFAIDELSVDGKLAMQDSPLELLGKVCGITTQPVIYGKPTTAELSGKSGAKSLLLSALLDHRAEPSSDKASFLLKGLPIKDYQLGNPDSLSLLVTGGNATVSGEAELKNGLLNAKILVQADNVSLSAKTSGEGLLASALKNSVQKINRLTVSILLKGDPQSPDIEVDSNLGQALADGLRGAFGSEIEKQKKQLEQLVGGATDKAKADITSLISRNGKDFGAPLGEQDKLLSGLSSEITSKLGVGKALPGALKIPGLKF